MSALVALTAQNTVAVTAVHELPSEFVVAQLEAVFDDIGVDAAKTGMLFSRRLIDTVADFLAAYRVPLVVDPVMVASSGARLLQEDAVATYVERLFPLAAVVTGGHGEAPGDLLLDEEGELVIAVERRPRRATHGSGCTHSATLAAHLARGSSLRDAARAAAAAAAAAVANGHEELGAGEGPVDVLAVGAAR